MTSCIEVYVDLQEIAFGLTFKINAISIALISFINLVKPSYLSICRYPKSFDSKIKYSASLADPSAVFKYFAKSGCVFLPQPSAMFAGMDEAARRNWLVRL